MSERITLDDRLADVEADVERRLFDGDDGDIWYGLLLLPLIVTLFLVGVLRRMTIARPPSEQP